MEQPGPNLTKPSDIYSCYAIESFTLLHSNCPCRLIRLDFNGEANGDDGSLRAPSGANYRTVLDEEETLVFLIVKEDLRPPACGQQGNVSNIVRVGSV